MTQKVNQFEIKDNVNLVFQSNGKLYQLRLVLTGGLLFLSELEKDKQNEERIIFLDESSHYEGEPVEAPTEAITEIKEDKPKRKTKKKK